MNVTQDLSFLALITNAHLIVQLIMGLLLGISLTSWTYIFRKMFAVRAARRQTVEFERSFWAGGNLNTLHQNASGNRAESGALARIFDAGMGEFIKGKASYGSREALIATAIGLFAAIPAVVAYNRFSHDIDRLAIRFESFVEEFSNILQRQSR